ncbi:MAG: imidazoleglycerol-phosphate dehydratase HisB [Melioribacteraceae bacterium]|nr:imidazoleglycerol-phosphate dehydratase HisB [Melioribacteraceae bacterium]
MKYALLEKTFFDFSDPVGSQLFESLLLLSDHGWRIVIESYNDLPAAVKTIIENERIGLYELPQEESAKVFTFRLSRGNNISKVRTDNDVFYDNIYDAVASVVKISRECEHKRTTRETDVNVKLNLDGTGNSNINSGIGFFDHMLEQISRHGNIDLDIQVNGDLQVDEHHSIEDVGITLGEAIVKALGNKSGIKRYGYFLPMDDSVAKVTLDLGGRPYLNFKCRFRRETVGEFPTELTEEFFKGLSQGMKANLYIRAKGNNDHHKIESIFKAFAKSLNEACRIDERAKGNLPSTKGVL